MAAEASEAAETAVALAADTVARPLSGQRVRQLPPDVEGGEIRFEHGSGTAWPHEKSPKLALLRQWCLQSVGGRS